jgi:hypothetical protein
MRTWFWWGNLKERDHLEDLIVDGNIRLKPTLKEQDRDRELYLIINV